MTPGGLLIGGLHKVEHIAADATGRLTGTPSVLGRLLDAERAMRQALRMVNRLRSDVVHALMIPTTDDVADVRRQLEKVNSSLAEIEARFEDSAEARRGEVQ